MYQISNTQQEWDTDLFHELMSDKRIHSSKEAKQIREQLANVGALPHLDNNFDWAMLCIAYCFVKGWAYQPKELIAAPDAKGTEIPSFNTCFQDYARLWLAVLSDALFHHNPKKNVSKDDLYDFIATLWHTGAVKLNEFWQRCRNFKPDDELAQRQEFLDELTQLAIKNSGMANRVTTDVIIKTDDLTEKMVQILQSDLKKSVKKAEFLEMGVRYDFYRIQFSNHVDWERIHESFCSAIPLPETSVWAERDTECGLPHTYRVKILRDESQWQKLEKGDLQQAIRAYSGHGKLPVCLGADEMGKAVWRDLADAPHTIIAGATGMGKSALMRAMLHGLFELADKQDTEIAIVYCKEYADFAEFQNAPNLWQNKIISETDEAFEVLKYFVEEMDKRYQQNEQAIKDNVLIQHKKMVLVIDELADLVLVNKEAEKQLVRLAIKARAAGIHLLLATQRPDANVLDGQLRDNLTVKVALRVDSRQASEIILKESGAEKLQGKGDHLVRWNGGAAQFLHGYNM